MTKDRKQRVDHRAQHAVTRGDYDWWEITIAIETLVLVVLAVLSLVRTLVNLMGASRNQAGLPVNYGLTVG